jgi:putative PIN family toxin of toxin-antitoxin system
VRVLLDSSILIAAIARPGVCTELIEEVARNHRLVVSEYILQEVERKLCEKFHLPMPEAAALVAGIREQAEIVTPASVPPEACRDPGDLPILGSGVAGNVDLLVTVDKDLLSLEEYNGIPMVRPGEFWRRLPLSNS